MAMTLEQFIKAAEAELVADRLIVGLGANRRFVGDVFDGTFNLNDEGKELLASLEAPKKPRAAKGAADPVVDDVVIPE